MWKSKQRRQKRSRKPDFGDFGEIQFRSRHTLNKGICRVTVDEYGYGRRCKLVVALEKGDLITIRELGRRMKHTARLFDVLWWMLRCEADNARMEKLRERKARKAARLAGR
jgi:hypothetical protein